MATDRRRITIDWLHQKNWIWIVSSRNLNKLNSDSPLSSSQGTGPDRRRRERRSSPAFYSYDKKLEQKNRFQPTTSSNPYSEKVRRRGCPKGDSARAKPLSRARTWGTKRVPIWLFLIFLISFLIFLFVLYRLSMAEVQRLGNFLSRPLRIGPVYARGIYVSSWTAGDPDQVDVLIDFILRTELNAVVVDIKDSTGRIAYRSEIDQANEQGTREIRIKDIKGLLEKFQSRGIYTIARIVVFRDPILSQIRPDIALKNNHTGKLWEDSGGISWLDPASREVWAYNVALAKEALEIGFEEINFDYVRFPSDGNIGSIVYPVWDKKIPRYEVIRQFFEYQSQQLKHVGRRSVDIFGMTMMNADTGYDMNIGQRFTDAVPYFNYISPMLYPSHFIDTFDDLENPAEHPYEVISRSFKKTQEHIVAPLIEKNKPVPKIRPWIQAFDLGAEYTFEMINLQKQAVLEGGGYGWLLWNARNKYTHIEEALKK